MQPNVTLVYGFKKPKPNYDTLLVLSQCENVTYIHGFISRVKLNFLEYINLWKHLKKTIQTQYLEFEILDKHAKWYQKVFPKAKIRNARTFNFWKCKYFQLDMKNENLLNKTKLKEITIQRRY